MEWSIQAKFADLLMIVILSEKNREQLKILDDQNGMSVIRWSLFLNNFGFSFYWFYSGRFSVNNIEEVRV